MRPAARWFFLLASGVLLVGLLLYFPTLSASFAYDDVDYLRDAADALAGKASYWNVVLRPQGEHFLPVLRMAIHASASLFGTEATPFRLFIFACHLGSAFFLGIIARRYLGGVAGLAAGLAYVAPAGFSSMWVWFPSGGSVPMGLLGITGGIAAIAWHSRIGRTRARWMAGAGAVFAVLCENTLIPLVLTPALVDEFERRREGRRPGPGPLTLFCLLLAILAAAASSLFYTRLTGHELTLNPRAAFPRLRLLLFVAPFRYFFPGTHLPRPFGRPEEYPTVASLFGIVVLLALAALFVAVYRRESRPLTTVALLAAFGSMGAVALVTLGRWKTLYEELYDADRYFFTLLIPISLLMAVLAHGIWRLATAWPPRRRVLIAALLAGAFLAELALHRNALLRRVPWGVYATHEKRFDQLSLLARRLSEAAEALPREAPPLHFPDTAFTVADVHNKKVSARFLLHVANPSKSARLVLSRPPVSERDAGILNPVLERWSRETGPEVPALAIVNGDLVDARAGEVDFRVREHAENVVSGFSFWQGVSRWMEKEGELRLRMTGRRLALILAVPWPSVQAKYPGRKSLGLRFSLEDELSGKRADLGVLNITAADVESYGLPVPEPFGTEARGHFVRLRIESDQIWRPIDVLPGSVDPREISVLVFRAAFE